MLRDYQIDILSKLREAWKVYRSVMVQMPTGTGKTHVLAALVREERRGKSEESNSNKGGVWVVAHRRELVEQIEETLRRYGTKMDDGRITVMSIQWLVRHIEEIREKPELIVVDEAHHALARTYRMLWEKHPEARFLGLTATPCRMNRSGFTDLFDTLITSYSIAEFIERGRLSTFDYVSIRPDSAEQRLIDSLEKRGADGDYQIKEMNDTLNRRQSIGQLYRCVLEYANDKKGIVYAISISHARNIAEYYSKKGINAVAIDSKTPTMERKRLVEEFKAGKIMVLVNVDVFSEGFDCPDVEFVQLARPTLSLSKYLQQVGRGLRKVEGKEACMIIDNVGLHHVFGLPTVAWDWEAMFRGETAGKGTHTGRQGKEQCAVTTPAEKRTKDNEMEVIFYHNDLLSALSEQKNTLPTAQQNTIPKLKAWQDAESGLWGLRRGRHITTAPMFLTVFDTGHDMAAVRFKDRNCGVVTASGEKIFEKGACESMRFAKNHFLAVRTIGGREHYVDLYNLRTYENRPQVKRFGNVELLKVDRTYYSRTKKIYVNDRNINDDYISDHRFYVTIFDYKVPAACIIEACRCGYACILTGDHDSFYWMYRPLADGSIIVTDGTGVFYHAAEGRDKTYIGSGEPALIAIERIAALADRTRHTLDSEKAGKRQLILDSPDAAVPFRAGTKWGLKVGDRVTVPPVYRNIKSPIGKYCAVEKNHSQWGVIALDGTLMVEPQYSDIEINAYGAVTGTKVTGSKIYVKLP